MASDWRLRARKALERGKKKGPIDQPSFEAFNFNVNPFSSNLPLEYDSAVLFDERFEKATEILGQFLTAKEETQSTSHLLVVGANFVGKTTLLNIMKETIEELDKTTHFIDAETLCENDGVIAHRNYEIWEEEIDRTKPDVIFIDNAAQLITHPTVLGLPDFDFHPIIVASISWCELDFLESMNNPKAQAFLDQFKKKRFYLRPIEEDAVKEVLIRRLKTGRDDPATIEELKTTDYIDPFTKAAIDEIAKRSLGLPGLAIELGTAALDLALNRGDETITALHIDDVADRAPYRSIDTIRQLTTIYTPSISTDNITESIQVLSQKYLKKPKKDILRQALRQAGKARLELGVTSMEERAAQQYGMLKVVALADVHNLQPSTLSYHLDMLKKAGFFEVYQMGREKPHYARREVIAALEIFFDREMSKGDEEIE